MLSFIEVAWVVVSLHSNRTVDEDEARGLISNPSPAFPNLESERENMLEDHMIWPSFPNQDGARLHPQCLLSAATVSPPVDLMDLVFYFPSRLCLTDFDIP